MSDLLDPWDDAARIAARLASPTNRLIVVIGAEAWCDKCREFKPHFDAVAANAPAHDLMLWLDLEDHQEFLGDYIPEDLPELLMYRQDTLLLRSAVPGMSQAAFKQALKAEPKQAAFVPRNEDPGIAKRLLEPNWAKNTDAN